MLRGLPRILPTGKDPYCPAPARIMRIVEMHPDVRLYDLRFTDPDLAENFSWKPGQFVELSILGAGEAPFSLPSSPTRRGVFQLGIRRAGKLTGHLFRNLKEGDEVGIRGPLGNGFPVEKFPGQDILLVAGGLGIVPIRGLLQYLIDLRENFGRIILLYGCRQPSELLFGMELESISRRGDAEIHLSVDRKADEPWKGHVGLVTDLAAEIDLDPARSMAVTCGPPVFYKFMIEELLRRGLSKDRIFLSLERRMECGIGKCGHCAVGYTFTCLHGPVFSYWDAINLPELIYT